MFIAALSTQSKGKNSPHVYKGVGKWLNKMWCMHTMEYYAAFKRNGILTYNIDKHENKPVSKREVMYNST
jgi:hypothetical protein